MSILSWRIILYSIFVCSSTCIACNVDLFIAKVKRIPYYFNKYIRLIFLLEYFVLFVFLLFFKSDEETEKLIVNRVFPTFNLLFIFLTFYWNDIESRSKQQELPVLYNKYNILKDMKKENEFKLYEDKIDKCIENTMNDINQQLDNAIRNREKGID